MFNLKILSNVNQLSYKILSHTQFFMLVKACFLDLHSNAPHTYIHTYIHTYMCVYIYIYIHLIITTEVINSIFYVCKSLLLTPFYQCRNPNNCHAAQQLRNHGTFCLCLIFVLRNIHIVAEFLECTFISAKQLNKNGTMRAYVQRQGHVSFLFSNNYKVAKRQTCPVVPHKKRKRSRQCRSCALHDKVDPFFMTAHYFHDFLQINPTHFYHMTCSYLI